MAQPLHPPATAATPPSSVNLFGIPIGELGWFGSLLIGVASGFMAFFATTFCAIVVILIVNSAAHSNIDFAISYRDIGLPIGLLVLVTALGYLGTLWTKRVLRKA
jgi:uncharacterized membrane protein YphA (DoxX/SURF4 family)